MPYRDADREFGESHAEGIVEEGKMEYGEVMALLHRMYAASRGEPVGVVATTQELGEAIQWLYDLDIGAQEDCDIAPEPGTDAIIDGLLRARFELGCEEAQLEELSNEYHARMQMHDALDAAIEELSK